LGIEELLGGRSWPICLKNEVEIWIEGQNQQVVERQGTWAQYVYLYWIFGICSLALVFKFNGERLTGACGCEVCGAASGWYQFGNLKRLRPPLIVKVLQDRGAYGSQVHENGNVMHEAGSVIRLVEDRGSKAIVPKPVLGRYLRLEYLTMVKVRATRLVGEKGRCGRTSAEADKLILSTRDDKALALVYTRNLYLAGMRAH
jgi:hypothetical protein